MLGSDGLCYPGHDGILEIGPNISKLHLLDSEFLAYYGFIVPFHYKKMYTLKIKQN